MSIKVNLNAKKEMNFSFLRRLIPSVELIVAEASLVSLYRYRKRILDGVKYWEKENVTGPLFVVRHQNNSSVCQFSLVVLNQEGLT